VLDPRYRTDIPSRGSAGGPRWALLCVRFGSYRPSFAGQERSYASNVYESGLRESERPLAHSDPVPSAIFRACVA
jgi:hypothetical protein